MKIIGINNKGFTLIELIVVFTVLAILSTVGTISLVTYSQTQILNQTTSDLVQTLNTAKSLSASQLKSLNRNGKTLQCLDYQTLSGYGVQINQAQNYYALYISCVGNGVVNAELSDPLWQTSLPQNQNVTFDSSTNITDVFFPILSGGFITKGTGSMDSIVVANYSKKKIIKLINGYISVQ